MSLPYGLTSIQEGMLFHHISDRTSGVDVEQIVCTLRETIVVEALQESWDATFRHVHRLGATFRWEGVEAPEQVDGPISAPRLQLRDAGDLAIGAAEEQIQAFLAADRITGFDLTCPPLSRLTLFRIAEREYRLIWSFPHILMDGRSFPIVLRDVFSRYDAATSGRTILEHPAPPSYRDFERWYRMRNAADEEKVWRDYLVGIASRTPLPFERLSDAVAGKQAPHGREDSERREIEDYLSLDDSRRLHAFAAQVGVSPGTIVQGSWGLLLALHAGTDDIVFGATRSGRSGSCEGAAKMVGVLINTLPVRVRVDPALQVGAWLRQLHEEQRALRPVEHASLVDIHRWCGVSGGSPLFESLLVYDHQRLGTVMRKGDDDSDREFQLLERAPFPLTLYAHGEHRIHLKLAHNRDRISDEGAEELLRQLRVVLASIAEDADRALGTLSLTDDAYDRRRELWNDTTHPVPAGATLHGLVADQLRSDPGREAVICGDQVLTARELDTLSNRIARHLLDAGACPGSVVGVALPRSAEMIAVLLGILKTGASYLPLDPGYPTDRLAFMLEDSGATIVVGTQGTLGPWVTDGPITVLLDRDRNAILTHDPGPLTDPAHPDDLAYVIYTSGSTGRPKGVQVEHRHVVNFLVGMDEVLRQDPENRGSWLSLTSLSFDISVLEIFWTLARGLTLVVFRDEVGEGGGDPGPFLASRSNGGSSTAVPSTARMEFSLFYFASDSRDEAPAAEGGRYRLLLEGARFADTHGFSAIWTPERHFHAFGGLYPNPSVTGAAVAAVTTRIGIRAGSVVLPLHHPARVAEEWSVVDNLSGGRVGLSLASGWHPNDFVLAPERHADRKAILYRDAEVVRRLWRGERVAFPGPDGSDVEVGILPRPVQPELPLWITTAGSPDTWIEAGRMGANVLTHLLGQTHEELEERIRAYRDAWQEAGHGPSGGQVSLMLHTFVGRDDDEVRELVREPMTAYLRSSVSLIRNFADAWTAYRKKASPERASGIPAVGGSANDFAQLPPEDMEALLAFSFERYFETSGLFGSPARCVQTARKLRELGVDEIACLIDFGVDEEQVLAHLPLLAEVLEQVNGGVPVARSEPTAAEQIREPGITHIQCTPSRLRMLMADPPTRDALAGVAWFLVGGEALPGALAEELRAVTGGRVLNMYGPTETTIWSSVHEVGPDDRTGTVPIGRPIANTSLYVLDAGFRPLPAGIPGELFIGGLGVVRGYLDRPELDAERFFPDPFAPPPLTGPAPRMYRTGDLVRRRPDGVLEFLGRTDHQVKLRGHRIELGEIEAALQELPQVADAAVLLREDAPGDQRLSAYLVAATNGADRANARDVPSPRGTDFVSTVSRHARARLPAVMVPSDFIVLDQLPLTPNRKVDRKALPAPRRVSRGADERPLGPGAEERRASAGNDRAPRGQVEQIVAALWQELLGIERVGLDDNFFDLGGHSLLTVRVHGRLRAAFGVDLRITDLFRYPTVRTLAAFLGTEPAESGSEAMAAGARDRGAMRRSVLRRRVPGGAST